MKNEGDPHTGTSPTLLGNSNHSRFDFVVSSWRQIKTRQSWGWPVSGCPFGLSGPLASPITDTAAAEVRPRGPDRRRDPEGQTAEVESHQAIVRAISNAEPSATRANWARAKYIRHRNFGRVWLRGTTASHNV